MKLSFSEDKLISPKYFKLKGGTDKSTTNIAVEFVNNSVKTTNPVEFNRMRDKSYDFDRVFGPQSSQQEAIHLFKREAILLLISPPLLTFLRSDL